MSNTIKQVETEGDFIDTLEGAGDKLVVVDFWASWCGPCKLIGPYFDKLAVEPEFSGVLFVKVDVDEISELAEEWGIQCMPTFVLIRNGEKVDSISGANREKLKEMITRNM